VAIAERTGKRPPRGAAAFSAQDFLIGLAEGTKTPEEIPAAVPRRSSRAVMGRPSIGRSVFGKEYHPECLFISCAMPVREQLSTAKRTQSAVSTKTHRTMRIHRPRPGRARCAGEIIVSSPLKRATQTAALVGNEMGHEGKLVLENALRPEASFSDFQKMLEKYARQDSYCWSVTPKPARISWTCDSDSGCEAVVELKKGAVAKVEMRRNSGR